MSEHHQIVDVTLSNRWARFGYYPDSLSKFFSYRKPGYYFAPAYKAGHWDGRTKLIAYKRIQSGLFLSMREEAEKKLGITFNVKKNRVLPEFRKIKESDRVYQVECLSAMQAASRCGGIILASTGVGKTFIAGSYFKALKGCGVFIVDELTLLRQTQKELSRVIGEEVGEIGDRKFLPKRITVATVQTMHIHRRDKAFDAWRNKLDVIIIDELHLALNKRNLSTVADIKAKAVFGLTATLQLSKADVRMRAYALCGPVIYTYPMKQGIDEKVLTPGVAIGIDIRKTEPESLSYQDLYNQVIVKGHEWNLAIRKLVKIGVQRGHAVIVIVDRVKHVRKLLRLVTEASIKARSVYGIKAVSTRINTKKMIESGAIDAIITNKVFQKGIDIKRPSVIIDGTSSKSKNNAVQRFGRGVRKHEDKTGLLYFDIGYVSNKPNRFAKAAKIRRSALRKAGIPVKCIPWTTATDAFNVAEKELAKLLKRLT